jgi:phenylpropionate dioxygenase-like ring-hydroxylating dioxygenase large terminal subunit
MLTRAENERITRVGPGTPMGTLMRRHWQPVLLREELGGPDSPPVRVRLLGEDLIAFCDSSGAVGLVDAFCPHRRAPMFFGRNEECGLRCVYHGWKFDRSGACVDMPSEPPGSLFKSKVTIGAYPTWEGGDLIWAYLGPADRMPAPPAFEFVRVPASRRNVVKVFQDNNWLQGLEGAIDSVHVTFLHNDDLRGDAALRRVPPEVEFERTVHGLWGAAVHVYGDGRKYVRAFGYVMPAHSLRVRMLTRTGSREDIPTISGQIWVPIDDERSWLYNYIYSLRPDRALEADFVAARNDGYGRGRDDMLPGYRLKRNRANDYLIDRDLQRTTTFSGIKGMITQDIALQEGMGPILDRSKEHAAYSDRVIIALRKSLLEAADAVERGEPAGGAEPADYAGVRLADAIVPETVGWKDALAFELLERP